MKFLASITVLLAILVATPGCAADDLPTATSRAAIRAKVAYVVDGDTLRVRLPSGQLDYARLVGIDTPEQGGSGAEVECGAVAATDSMRQLAPEGATVLLRVDSVADERDRYGRLLAHAFVGGRQLGLAQLRSGWAEVYRFQGQRFDGLPRFERAERSARQAGRGAWSLCGGDFHSAR